MIAKECRNNFFGIVSINGQQIRTQADYDRILRNSNGPVDIQYRRNGQMHTSQLAWNADQPRRHEIFYCGADPSQNSPVQKDDAVQKGSAVQKGYGCAYYSDSGCSKHRHRCRHHRGHHHIHRRAYR